MTLSDSSLYALAASHDIISIGAAADDRRRALHGARTTYVRVADVSATPGEAVEVPEAAGEVRIVGIPASSAAAVTRVREVCAAARGIPVSGYSLADLEALAGAEQQPLRALLESLRAAGLELVAEAPLDRLRDARAAIEEVNIAGLALARLVIETLPEPALTSDDRTRRLDLDALRLEVDSWFSPEALDAVLGPAAGDADRVAREWLCADGKRWRPFLTVCAYKALQDDPSEIGRAHV